MHPASDPAIDRLTQRLTELREGRTGEDLAGLLGWSTAKVSRIFSGKQIISEQDATTFTERAGHPEALDELLALRQAAATVHTQWKRRLEDGGEESVQQEIGDLEQAATLVRAVEGYVIPGQLQTPGYARGIFTQVLRIYPDISIDQAVAGRMERRKILHDEIRPGFLRQFQFVIGYAALVSPPCPPRAMFEQLHFLLLSMDLSNVTMGIIPQGRQLAMTPYNGFLMLDDLLVVESFGYEDQVTGSVAARHAEIFKMLMAEAAQEDDARALIDKAMKALQ